MLVHDVPKIMCYADADTFMNKTSPIRGTNIRPLGARRYHNARWMAFCNAPYHKHSIEVGTYANDPVVRFHTNGNIDFMLGRWELNARQLVGAMFKGRFVPRYANRYKWYLYDLVKHIQYPVTPQKPLTLKYVKTEQGSDYVFDGELVPEQKPYVIRSAYMPLIKQYREFLKYIEVMNKLAGGSYDEDAIWGSESALKVAAPIEKQVEDLMKQIRGKTMESSTDEFAVAFNLLLRDCARFRGYPHTHYECSTRELKDYVYRWVKEAHKETIYEMRDVPNGTIIKRVELGSVQH